MQIAQRLLISPALLAGLLCTTGCGRVEGGGSKQRVDEKISPDATTAPLVVIPDRTPRLATFPCMQQCHAAREPNPNPRPLTAFHSLKQIEHGDTTFWCTFCHNDQNLDTLRLLDGRTVTFNESYRLCGECHGDKRRDWQAGIHGLQSGSWDGRGEKVRRACTACHDPHAPKRPSFQALPAPKPRGERHE